MSPARDVALRLSTWYRLGIDWDRLPMGTCSTTLATTILDSRFGDGGAGKATCLPPSQHTSIKQTRHGHLRTRAPPIHSRYRLHLLAPTVRVNNLIHNGFPLKGSGCASATLLLNHIRSGPRSSMDSEPRIMGSGHQLSHHSGCGLHRPGMAISHSYDGILCVLVEFIRR